MNLIINLQNRVALAVFVLGLLPGSHLLWGRQGPGTATLPSIQEMTRDMQRHEGFIPFYWDARRGKIWLEISRFDEEFLYVNALSAGLGSNPVGLDRSQLGRTRIVKFIRVGPRLLLLQPNFRFRALTNDVSERKAVQDSFARSVLWSGEIAARSGDSVLVDATSFFIRDAHRVVERLKRTGQGSFRLDPSRSVVYLPRTKAFPKNSEFEAMLTFTSSEPGREVVQTTPTPEAVTLREHYSFIQLPDDGYRPRRFDPRAPSFGVTFADYASPIDKPLEKRWIARHRLRKKNPRAVLSEPVKPIVYYVDSGAPEPIRSALIQGASWWNQAFEAAGYKDAFRVEVLPEGADPLDIRYNVIEWVHRATRGWSYGSSVIDPRTGEILKGHVLLGSLRVRQDFLITRGLNPLYTALSSAEGTLDFEGPSGAEMLVPYDPNSDGVQVALARIRQLAAHETGHTLGFAHNFAASTYGRASVMDYPAPLVNITPQGDLDLSHAYAVGIGKWDKFAVRYAYSDFPPGTNEQAALDQMVQKALSEGMFFLTDADARPAGAANPLDNLWDNGSDPVQQLDHVMQVRRIALDRFGEKNIPQGEPLSELENALVPLYLYQRYQVAATAKLLGGVNYRYALRGDGQQAVSWVSGQRQRRALQALLRTLSPAELTLPAQILRLLPPLPFGYSDRRELFPGRMNRVFDPLSAAEVAADLTVSALLQPERVNRIAAFSSLNPNAPSLDEVIGALLKVSWQADPPPERWRAATQRVVDQVVLEHLIELAADSRTGADARAVVDSRLRDLARQLSQQPAGLTPLQLAQRRLARERINRFLNRSFGAEKPSRQLPAPPGDPIGSGH